MGLSSQRSGSPLRLLCTLVIASLTGMLLGDRIGQRWGTRVEILGGLILIGIGTKILLEHLLGN